MTEKIKKLEQLVPCFRVLRSERTDLSHRCSHTCSYQYMTGTWTPGLPTSVSGFQLFPVLHYVCKWPTWARHSKTILGRISINGQICLPRSSIRLRVQLDLMKAQQHHTTRTILDLYKPCCTIVVLKHYRKYRALWESNLWIQHPHQRWFPNK